jgi:hypothetical protein
VLVAYDLPGACEPVGWVYTDTWDAEDSTGTSDQRKAVVLGARCPPVVVVPASRAATTGARMVWNPAWSGTQPITSLTIEHSSQGR